MKRMAPHGPRATVGVREIVPESKIFFATASLQLVHVHNLKTGSDSNFLIN